MVNLQCLRIHQQLQITIKNDEFRKNRIKKLKIVKAVFNEVISYNSPYFKHSRIIRKEQIHMDRRYAQLKEKTGNQFQRDSKHQNYFPVYDDSKKQYFKQRFNSINRHNETKISDKDKFSSQLKLKKLQIDRYKIEDQQNRILKEQRLNNNDSFDSYEVTDNRFNKLVKNQSNQNIEKDNVQLHVKQYKQQECFSGGTKKLKMNMKLKENPSKQLQYAARKMLSMLQQAQKLPKIIDSQLQNDFKSQFQNDNQLIQYDNQLLRYGLINKRSTGKPNKNQQQLIKIAQFLQTHKNSSAAISKKFNIEKIDTIHTFTRSAIAKGLTQLKLLMKNTKTHDISHIDSQPMIKKLVMKLSTEKCDNNEELVELRNFLLRIYLNKNGFRYKDSAQDYQRCCFTLIKFYKVLQQGRAPI